MHIEYHKAICVASLVVMLFASSAIRADETQSAVSSTIAGTTKEYLSDPARTGSLVGSIIAGSALANPLAPLLGSVIGFVIGKSSAFSKGRGSTQRPDAYSNRSLIPDDGVEITSLVGLSGPSSLDTLAADGVTIFEDKDAGAGHGSTINSGLVENAVAGSQQEDVPTLAAAKPVPSNNRSNQIVIVESTDQPGMASSKELLVTTDRVREADMSVQPAHTTVRGLSAESAGATDLQKMLADACSNVDAVKPASLNCYYYAQ